MAKNFLDFEGLQIYDAKLKEWVRRQGSATSADWNEKDPTSKSFIANKPFGETGSEFPLVSVHLADGEGHEGEIENNDIANAVYTATPADNLIYVGESTGWPETEFDHVIWEGEEGKFTSMYFYGPTLDMSGYVSSAEEFESQKLEVTYNGTSYSFPLTPEHEGSSSFSIGQHNYQSYEYVFEYPFRVEISFDTVSNDETGEDDLDFSHVFFITYVLCNHPFDISIGFSNKQIIKLDNKYLNIAQSITDGETGLATGDQVYDATLVKTSRETQISPNEIVDFVEIKPTSTYSSSVITDYTEE